MKLLSHVLYCIMNHYRLAPAQKGSSTDDVSNCKPILVVSVVVNLVAIQLSRVLYNLAGSKQVYCTAQQVAYRSTVQLNR